MKPDVYTGRKTGFAAAGSLNGLRLHIEKNQSPLRFRQGLWMMVNGWCDIIAPCPWSAHAGLNAFGSSEGCVDQALFVVPSNLSTGKPPLYTPEERRRRDASPWTLVQGILAPLQFVAFAASLALIVHYLTTGQGYALATGSILVKTALLYAIMITGSIWEKAVFGKWLFARAFFWEDVFSILVLGLQTAYVAALLTGWGTPRQQMLIAVAAYAAYAFNASQFLLKLRAARLQGASRTAAKGASGGLAGFAT